MVVDMSIADRKLDPDEWDMLEDISAKLGFEEETATKLAEAALKKAKRHENVAVLRDRKLRKRARERASEGWSTSFFDALFEIGKIVYFFSATPEARKYRRIHGRYPS